MELLYSIDLDSGSQQKDWISEEKPCCSLSCQNVLCICKQSRCGKQNAGDCEEKSGKFNTVYEVVVFDLDKPWDAFTVMTHTTAITCVTWDRTGSRILITDVEGTCQVWQMQDFLLNKWTLLGSSEMAGEEILSVSWFHTGVQINFNPEKKDILAYSDKFPRSKFTASVSQFGGKPLDGWIAVTGTGLISVGVINQQEQCVQTAQGSLGSSHLRLSLASIAHTGTGQIMVATGDGQLSTTIQCFLVNIEMNQSVVSVTSSSSSSLYMKSQLEYGGQDQRMMVTHIQFLNGESSDTLLLCCGGQGYSCLEIWHLIDQHIPLNKMLQINTGADTGYKIPKWMHKVTLSHPAYLTAVAGPNLPMSKTFMEAGFSPYIAVCYRDSTIKLIHRYTHQVLHTSHDIIKQQNSGLSPSKKLKTSPHIVNLIQTLSGCGLIAMHDGKVSVLRVYNIRDGSLVMSPSYVCLLLEYAMLTGQDWWDIMLAVKQNAIDGISQKLTENYFKQSSPMQDVVSLRLVALKVALYSSANNGHQKAMDYHTRLVLQAITAIFRGLLRPKSASTQDKTPAEKLSLLCKKTTDVNLETLRMNLDVEDFLIDSRRTDRTVGNVALQSLQPLIQWVADFTLHLMALIPMYQSYAVFPGSSLLMDRSLLNTLRELLVMIRVWGFISPGCLPVFTTASSTDCLAHLFKVLTKAWQCCKDGSGIDCDDQLLEDCCLLPNKIVIPSMNQSFRLDDSGYAIFTQPIPQSFTFGNEPEYMYSRKKIKFPFLSDVLTESRQNHDIIRQVHLGARPAEGVRKCCRCGGFSLLKSLAKSPIMKSWESRWRKNCLCGGHWQVVAG